MAKVCFTKANDQVCAFYNAQSLVVWADLMWASLICGVLIDYAQGWPEPYIYGVYTVFMAGKPPNIQSYLV